MSTINILTVKQAAEKLQVSATVVYALCKKPDFPAMRIGTIIRIPEDSLESWIQSKAQKEEAD